MFPSFCSDGVKQNHVWYFDREYVSMTHSSDDQETRLFCSETVKVMVDCVSDWCDACDTVMIMGLCMRGCDAANTCTG